jgi:hypothetical protein
MKVTTLNTFYAPSVLEAAVLRQCTVNCVYFYLFSDLYLQQVVTMVTLAVLSVVGMFTQFAFNYKCSFSTEYEFILGKVTYATFTLLTHIYIYIKRHLTEENYI